MRLDGKPVRRPFAGREVELKGEWKDRGIRVERKVADGPSETESWTVDERGRLVVIHTIELPRGPKVELKRVYRRATAG